MGNLRDNHPELFYNTDDAINTVDKIKKKKFNLKEERVKKATRFIKTFLVPRKTFNYKYSTYNLKHIAERVFRSLGFKEDNYISEDDLKQALLNENYKLKDASYSTYTNFNIVTLEDINYIGSCRE